MCFSTFERMDTQQSNKTKAEDLAFLVCARVHWLIHIGSCAHTKEANLQLFFLT